MGRVRGDFLRAAICSGLALGPISCGPAPETTGRRPNILFIAVDDLRPELGCYGHPRIQTPHLDGLAERGLRFERAYCQTAVCMPSRVSVLSGYRPESVGFPGRFSSGKLPRKAVSLPRILRNEGYTTVSIGKVYHENDDDPAGWTRRHGDTFQEEALCQGYCSGYQLESNRGALPNYFEAITEAELPRPTSCEMSDTPDEAHPDGMIARRAMEELGRLKEEGRPFFLAAGFYRPHLPFTPPKRYWELYQREEVGLPENPQPVSNGITRNNWDELRRYGDIPNKGPVSDAKARELIHGYYASVSFVDAQVGKVLAELRRLDLERDTVIVLWGDHGWNLGEHGWWCKHINVETSTRTTMMIHVPWKQGQGRSTTALVELVDIYPSLCELAGIGLPAHLEGTSFVPLLEDPQYPWKKAAFSEINGARTVRTDRYRLIRHPDGRLELFDHRNDPGEDANVADDPGYGGVVDELKGLLRQGWRSARPGK